jgi:predicted dehydrogenase
MSRRSAMPLRCVPNESDQDGAAAVQTEVNPVAGLRPLSFVVAGLGSAGQRHLRNLSHLGVDDISLYRTGKGSLSSPTLSSFPVHWDFDEALAGEPDAVIIANPTALHMETALKAARRGCHVFLEKPVSHSLVGVEELRSLTREFGLIVFVGFQWRFNPGLRRIRQWIEEGRIGRVVMTQARWGECLPLWHPWEYYRTSYSAREDLGGGVMLTLCHPIDYLRWLIGEVESVYAVSGTLCGLDLSVEDTALITLRFACGALGSVSLDYVQNPRRHDLLIVGQNGSISWNASDSRARLVQGSGDLVIYTPPPWFERNEMFVDELSHFIDCVRGDTTPSCTLEDGIQSLRIVLQAKQSAQERRELRVE